MRLLDEISVKLRINSDPFDDMSTLPLRSSQSFLFSPETLAQRLVQESDCSCTGYWYHRFHRGAQSGVPGDWYLGLMEGRAIFADSSLLSVGRLCTIIECYVPRLKSQETKQIFEALRQKLIPEDYEYQLKALPVFLSSCYDLSLVRPEEVKQALRLKLLADLDEVLFGYGGQAQFLPEADFAHQVPIEGFSLSDLMSEAHRRRLIWDKVKAVIPSADGILALNESAIRRANLTFQQEQQLRVLVGEGRSLQAISAALSQDPLEIAKGLAQLVSQGLLVIQSAAKSTESEILIIDDSPLMLQQFKTLVSSWGYKVRSHSDPTSALEMMTQANPIAIFLDINMPELSGFDLLKQIRRHPNLAHVPLIMLTAERTLSNNWRAQWSGCQFLTKPLAPDEIPQFKQSLRILLESMFPED